MIKFNNKKYKKENKPENLQTGFGDFKAKKALGQNFLKSKEALLTMCQAGEVKNGDIVIEIGPGKGALTEKLLEKTDRIIAIEKDSDLIKILNDKFQNKVIFKEKIEKTPKNHKKTLKISKPGLEIWEGDCLDFEPDVYLKDAKYKIVANIPYNITGAIIKKFLSEVQNKPQSMTLLVQKEVAERIVARDNKESVLSISVKAYGEPKYIMKVHKRFFSPSPKVDSAIISIKNISDRHFNSKIEEKSFFNLIKAGFGHKRKVLLRNLEKSTGNQKNISEIFDKLKIDNKKRAEDLSFDDWIKINKEINNFI